MLAGHRLRTDLDLGEGDDGAPGYGGHTHSLWSDDTLGQGFAAMFAALESYVLRGDKRIRIRTWP